MILHPVKRYLWESKVLLVLLFQIVSVSLGLDARVSLNVEGEGSHRNLIYRVNFDEFVERCHTAIYLELPPALYVNVDELADLRRRGISTACSIGETDVELFMENAKPQNVTICVPLSTKECTLELPIHQRYQYAKKDGGYTTVTLPKPKLLLGCKERVKEYRVSKTGICSLCAEAVNKWREIPYAWVNDCRYKDNDSEEFVWLVPVGDSTMLTIISYVTLLTTILGAIYITNTVWKSIPEDHRKND